jgi:hypothetical protein
MQNSCPNFQFPVWRLSHFTAIVSGPCRGNATNHRASPLSPRHNARAPRAPVPFCAMPRCHSKALARPPAVQRNARLRAWLVGPWAIIKTLRFWGFQPEPELALVLWLSETQSGQSYGCACYIGGGWFPPVAGPRSRWRFQFQFGNRHTAVSEVKQPPRNRFGSKAVTNL